MEKNKSRQLIKFLEKKIVPLQKQINEIQEKEELEVQLPRIKKMIGWCLRSDYSSRDIRVAKIIDIVYDKDGYPSFILEEVFLDEQGIPTITLGEKYPFLNKEWWGTEVPLSGWKRIPIKEYENKKALVFKELQTQKMLRKIIEKRK